MLPTMPADIAKDDTAKDDLAALLAWYQDMGVDACLGETPVDWLARDNAVPGAELGDVLRRMTTADGLAAAGGPTAPGRITEPTGRPAAAGPGAPATTPTARSASSPQPQAGAGHDNRAGSSAGPGAPLTRRFPTSAPNEAVSAARARARSAKSLQELAQLLAGFDGCALKATAKNLCFYRGAPQAHIMIIGEAPGRDEDLAGKPFVGRAGMLLDKMLAAIDLDESAIHITNVVYWRPPGNRTPTPHETQICRPFLERQIELVAPEVMLLLGGSAAKTMFGVRDGIMRLRGKWRDVQVGGTACKAIATLHPAYLLRTTIAKRLAWRDLQKVKAALGP